MIILGIDPGTRRVGFGVVSKNGPSLRFLDAGLLGIKSSNDISALKEIKDGLEKLCSMYNPEFLAVEKLFFSKNQKTALQVAEARGVILLFARENGLKIKEFSPNEVKSALTGYGSADKKAVLKMVGLRLKKQGLKIIDDAADALALAVVASDQLRFDPKKY
jgi:crossover junction endodeoxyribonuclease RuvC